MVRKTYFIGVIVLLSCGSLWGQISPGGPVARLFNTRDGLPDNKVVQIIETRKSPFIWVVTRNELCRFDGYRFQTVWERLPEISGFVENSRGELIIWHRDTARGFSCFNPNTGAKTNKTFADIQGLDGATDQIWVQDTMMFMITELNSKSQLAVYRLYPDFKVKLLRYIPKIPYFYKLAGEPKSNKICLWDEKNECLWFAGGDFGPANIISRWTYRSDKTESFTLKTKKPNESLHISISPSGVLLLYSSQSNEIWTWQDGGFHILSQKPDYKAGLSRIGTDQKGAIIFRKAEKDINDLWIFHSDGTWTDLRPLVPSLNFMAATGRDFSRQILFATQEGLFRVNFDKPLFRSFVPQRSGFINYAFRGINQDAHNRIFAVGEMLGLYRLTAPGGSRFEPFEVREKISGKSVLTNNAVNLQFDAQGFLWSARNAGAPHNLLRIDPETGRADTFYLNHQTVNTFLVLRNGNVLVGASQGKNTPFALLDPVARRFHPLTYSGNSPHSKNAPLYLLENQEGKVWVGSQGGLALLDPERGHWLGFPGNDSTAGKFPVAVIFAEGDKNLWLGTLGGGLLKLALKTGKWETFTTADGLPSNKIAGILSDENGNLWISTYNGLSFFQQEFKMFTNFFDYNGLSHNEFNRFSFFKSTDGTLFFGGLNGINFFKPAEVLASFSQGYDSLLISQISWFAPDGKTKKEQIFNAENGQKITLPPGNRFLSIRLALANYLMPEANRFSWKLEGHEDHWHLNGTDNEITFHYLPAGTYRLRIRAANPTGVWGKNERVLVVEVLEFWYKSIWFYLLLVATAAGLFYFFYKTRVRQKLDSAENRRIRELEHLRSRLYTNITHEFRTPLTVILGMAERLKDDDRLSGAEKKEGLSLIQRNGQNLLRLINQLLDLSKIESGAMKIKLVRADVIAYLQYLTESFYSTAQERGIRLVFYPETPRAIVDFDEEKLQDIVFNLLSNALKFTGSGGKVVFHAKVPETNSPESRSFLQLKIQDTGQGISREQLPHIFDRFYQADNSSTRKTEGTGIGLALVKELVELLGGNISAESELGKGSLFSVILPLAGMSEAADIPSMSVPVHKNQDLQKIDLLAETPVEPGDMPTLLIIEDNADVVTYITAILKSDYRIDTAANGKIGIEKALETVPDIVISDVMMPEMDGYEVCDTLKNDERTSHIPIVLLTAKATQEDKVAGLRAGADVYLQKPFDKAELLVHLEKLVELRRRLQERYAGEGKNPRDFRSLEDSKNNPTLDDLFLQKIRRLILEKIDDPALGILDLCHATRLSRTQLFRKLKALTGENPTLFIRRLRLERAIELLKTTAMNISEVAYAVGFSDPNYFSRSFSETYGTAPSDIRT